MDTKLQKLDLCNGLTSAFVHRQELAIKSEYQLCSITKQMWNTLIKRTLLQKLYLVVIEKLDRQHQHTGMKYIKILSYSTAWKEE